MAVDRLTLIAAAGLLAATSAAAVRAGCAAA